MSGPLDLDATQLAIEERIGWFLTEIKTLRETVRTLRVQRQDALDVVNDARYPGLALAASR